MRPLLVPVCLLFAAPAAAAPLELRQSSTVLSLAWSDDAKQLAIGTADGFIQILAIPGAREVARLNHETPVKGLVFSPGSKWLGTKSGTVDGPLSIWDLSTGRRLKQLSYKGYSCDQLAFSADGQTLVAVCPGEHMMWHHVKGTGQGTRTGQVPAGSSAAAAANGTRLGWSTPDGRMLMQSLESRGVLTLALGPVEAFAFSPDANWLAIAAPDKSLRLRPVDGTDGRRFDGLREPARFVQFAGNGKVLVAAAPSDPAVRLWDVATTRQRRRVATPPGLRAVALSPDGLTLALAGSTHVFIWNVATRDLGPLGPPLRLGAAELDAAWQDLASTDVARAEAAFAQFARAQGHALQFLRAQLRAVAVPPVDHERIAHRIAELDHPVYQVRQRAFTELAAQGEIPVPALEQYLAREPPLEGKRRAVKLLEGQRLRETTPDHVRGLETIELLEICNTPEARAVLAEIARDALVTHLRVTAREALGRVEQQTP
jgi:hypothetical protein